MHAASTDDGPPAAGTRGAECALISSHKDAATADARGPEPGPRDCRIGHGDNPRERECETGVGHGPTLCLVLTLNGFAMPGHHATLPAAGSSAGASPAATAVASASAAAAAVLSAARCARRCATSTAHAL